MKILHFVLVVILLINACKQNYLETKFKLTDSELYYPKNEWKNELGYRDTSLFNITLEPKSSIPQLTVEFENKTYPLYFDFGNSKDILISTVLENEIKYSIIKEDQTFWADGSIRGNIYIIEIPEMIFLNKKYYNVQATLANWKIFSSNPFNGSVSMDYFSDLRFTLDYRQKLLACTNQPFPYDSTTNNYLINELIKFNYHPYGIHFMGEVNNVKSLIYFDTGRNKTMINRNLVESEKIISDKSGTFYNGIIPLKFNELELELQFPRIDDIERGIDYAYPIGIAVGSDLLKYFVLTVDRTNNNDILIIHR